METKLWLPPVGKSNSKLTDAELLKWCNQYTKGHDHIPPASDLNKCWEDGLCFCALLYSFFPEKIPIDALMHKETREDKVNNLRLAFAVATDAGIYPHINEEKYVDAPESLAKDVIYYLNSIHEILATKPVKFQASPKWLKKFEEDEKTRKLLELKQRNFMMGSDIDIKALLKSRDFQQLTAVIQAMKASDNSQTRLDAKRIEDVILERQDEDRLRARAKALIYDSSPDDHAEVQKARENARKKIYEIQSEEEREREAKKREEEKPTTETKEISENTVEYNIAGKGMKGGTVGKLCVFSVNILVGGKKPHDSNKHDLACCIEGPSKRINIMISGGAGGMFHVGFTPEHPGQHWCDFQYKGNWLNAQPYCLSILGPTNTCPEYPYTGREKRELDGKSNSSDAEHDAKAAAHEENLSEGEKERERERDREREKMNQKIQELEKEIHSILEITPEETEELRTQANAMIQEQKLEAILTTITYTFFDSNSTGGNASKFEVFVNGANLSEKEPKFVRLLSRGHHEPRTRGSVKKKKRSRSFVRATKKMGNKVEKPMADKLYVTYDGQVCGLLKEGVILSNHTHGRALDPTITTCMLKSLGTVEKIKLVEKDDLEEFSIEITHPKCKHYTPFFFNRHNEYGKDHKYYESLCHAFPTREILNTSSARYFKRNGEALLVQHLPVTLPICAFLEAFREKNKTFLEDLRSELYLFIKNIDMTDENFKNNLPLSNEMADSVIDGAFRNVSVQIHYSACSHTMDLLTHMDHVFSSLHMGVTLHGRRSVGFMTHGDNPYNSKPKILEMEEGDIYVTTPAAILHGIQMEDMKCEQRSVALQCRTHLDAKEAQTWSQYKRELSGVVQVCLKRNTITIPNLEEFNIILKDLETKCPYDETIDKYLFVNKEPL